MNTTDITVQGYDYSLFDIMYGLKSIIDCRFEFKFSIKEQNIVMACYLPNGYIYAAFIITERKQENEDNAKSHHAYNIFADENN